MSPILRGTEELAALVCSTLERHGVSVVLLGRERRVDLFQQALKPGETVLELGYGHGRTLKKMLDQKVRVAVESIPRR